MASLRLMIPECTDCVNPVPQGCSTGRVLGARVAILVGVGAMALAARGGRGKLEIGDSSGGLSGIPALRASGRH